MELTPTIAAIATARGAAGVAIVRVSGPAAFAIAVRLTRGRVHAPYGARPEASYARLYAPTHSAGSCESPEFLDEGLVLTFKAPRSYTGEDVVEFQCHGGFVTPRRVLDAALAAGARLAERGEFTRRAFLNGKISFDAAESLLDLIEAKTVRAADAALEGLSGCRLRRYRELYDEALALSAELEHALDVEEGELPPDFVPTVIQRRLALLAHLDAAIRQSREGRLLRDGVLVVLSGPPNVGKSSLLNALLGENRAIVSAVPGTTRDVLEAWLDMDGWPVRLVDTAGLRTTTDALEHEGVQRAASWASRADIVLRLFEGDVPSVASQGDARTLHVRTKADLGAVPPLPDGVIAVSAQTGMGLAELKAALVARMERLAPREMPVAAEELIDVRRALVEGATDDLVLLANGLRTVAERLGRLVGATYSEDMLDRLFARFCVGK